MKIWTLVVGTLALMFGLGCEVKPEVPVNPASTRTQLKLKQEVPITAASADNAHPEPTIEASRQAPEIEDLPAVEGDQFAKDQEWVGKRVEVTTNKQKMRAFKFVVTKRAGDQLQGMFEFPILDAGGRYPTYPVQGSAPATGDGVVRFSTLGHLRSSQLTFEGKIEGGEMWLIYSGNLAWTGEAVGVGMMKVNNKPSPKTTGRLRPPRVRNSAKAEQQEWDKLHNSEYFTAATKLAEKTRDSFAAMKIAINKEAEKLTQDELYRALWAKHPTTLEDRTRFAIYNARLQVLRESLMTPEERLARMQMAAYLLAAALSGEGSEIDRDKQAREEYDRYIQNRAIAESEMKRSGP